MGDGGSSSFKRLRESDPYHGMESLRKEECIGHAQKRLKKALRKKTTKALTSKPISPSKVERIGHLYALVIVQNRRKTALDIQKALYILLDHLVEKHEGCPFSKSSWCYFQQTLALSVEDSSIPPPKLRQPYLNANEFSRLQDVFLKFASLDMCSASTLGLTQNANESLHSILWHNAPKGKRVGQYSLQASASIAVSTFNEGSMILASILADMGVQCSRVTLAHFVSMDKERNRGKKKAIKDTQKRRRRLLKSQFMVAESSRRKREKDATTYKSGCFGSEVSSSGTKELIPTSGVDNDENDICQTCGMHDCPVLRDQQNDDWVGCDFCENWYHTGCEDVWLADIGKDPYICRKCEQEWNNK